MLLWYTIDEPGESMPLSHRITIIPCHKHEPRAPKYNLLSQRIARLITRRRPYKTPFRTKGRLRLNQIPRPLPSHLPMPELRKLPF